LTQIALSVRMTLKLFFTYFGHAILLGNFGKMLVRLFMLIQMPALL